MIGANLTLDSTAFRHGIRLGVVAPAAALLAQESGLQRGYWLALTAVVVLRPDFAATLTRARRAFVGTVVGVAVAGGLTTALHPSGWVVVILATVWGFAAYTVFQASYAAATVAITGLVVLFVSLVSAESASVETARLVDTLVGGAFR